MPFHIFLVVAILTLVGFSSSVFAHAQLTMNSATPPRFDSNDIKAPATGPGCGIPNSGLAPTNIKSFFPENAMIYVECKQFQYHKLNYKVDFSPANDMNFDTANVVVVPDEPRDVDNKLFSAVFTLKYPPCEACTLRMRQFMDVGGVYYSCADIVIFDPTDNAPPSLLTTSSTSTDTSVTLQWTNPSDLDFSEVVILRKVINNGTSQFDEALTQHTYYPIAEVVGATGAEVVGSSKENTFTDSGLSAETTYAYKVFARDTNYNYNAGTMVTAITLASTSGGGTDTGTGGDPGTGGTTTPSSSDSGGALWGGLFLLLAYGVRRTLLQRKSV